MSTKFSSKSILWRKKKCSGDKYDLKYLVYVEFLFLFFFKPTLQPGKPGMYPFYYLNPSGYGGFHSFASIPIRINFQWANTKQFTITSLRHIYVSIFSPQNECMFSIHLQKVLNDIDWIWTNQFRYICIEWISR